jgi:hypothetical protein
MMGVTSTGQDPRINYTNKTSIHVTGNDDSQSKQQAAMFAARLSKVGKTTLQGSLQSNRTQQQAAAHNQNQYTSLNKQIPQLYPHA